MFYELLFLIVTSEMCNKLAHVYNRFLGRSAVTQPSIICFNHMDEWQKYDYRL